MGSVERVVARSTTGRRWAKTIAHRFESPVVAVAGRIAREFGLSQAEIDRAIGGSVAPSAIDAIDQVEPPENGWSDSWLIGEVHEHAVSGRERRRRGAWYTPRPVARRLANLTLDAASEPMFTVDPCCGGGGFLLAAADRLAQDLDPATVVGLLAGHDVDAGAIRAARAAVTLWAVSRGVDVGEASDLAAARITQADSLSHLDESWPGRRCVLGNPPFASPLKLGAVAPAAEVYRRVHSEDLGPYADLASLHLHRSVVACHPGSVVALVQPQSVLAGRDGRQLRALVDERASLVAMWVTRRAVFDAGTRVCAPVLKIGEGHDCPVRLESDGGESREQVVTTARAVGEGSGTQIGCDGAAGKSLKSWSELAATALGSPVLPVGMRKPADRLESLVTATAGFRDEYYGLTKAAREETSAGRPGLKLVTVGSVEPLVTTWGAEQIRLAGQRWSRPVVDLDDLDDKVRRWTENQLQPKIVLATQSKVLEPVIDTNGRLVPLTPLLSVLCRPDDLHLVAAVLLAPPVVALSWQRTFGTAMSVDALKLAARDVGDLPLPQNRRAWYRAAALLQEADLPALGGDVQAGWTTAVEVGRVMTAAYGADESVFDWWVSRAKKSWRPVTERSAN